MIRMPLGVKRRRKGERRRRRRRGGGFKLLNRFALKWLTDEVKTKITAKNLNMQELPRNTSRTVSQTDKTKVDFFCMNV